MQAPRLLPVLAVLLACAREPDAPRPNVLLVVVDTLRADHVGAGGYGLDTTPVIDGLVARGTWFSQAIASAPWTRPSMASLLTGLDPGTVGLTCHNFRVPEADCDVLPASVTTLAERLRAAGWETAGVVANINVDPVFGFDQGFEEYVSISELIASPEAQGGDDWRRGNDWLRHSTERTADEAIAWVERRADLRPFLLYVHFLDPHAPYEPPAELAAGFPPAGYGRGAELGGILSRYDGEIRLVDAALERLLAALERRGQLANTVVVLTSDHGEEFQDHGGMEHGWTLYDEQLRVPLAVVVPGAETASRVDDQVRLVDVVPTVLDLTGLGSREALAGRSLAPLLFGERLPPAPAVSGFGYTPLASLRSPPWKLIVDDASGAARLYDLDADPGESTDVSGAHPEVVRRMRAELEQARRAAAGARAAYPADSELKELSATQAEGLEAIGYTDD